MIELFKKPTLAKQAFKVGENTLVLSEFTAAFYMNHVLDEAAVGAANSEVDGETPEDRLAKMRQSNAHYLRYCAASVVQDFIDPSATLEEEEAAVKEVFEQLKANLTSTQLGEMYTAVLKLANPDPDPKPSGQTETLATSSAEN